MNKNDNDIKNYTIHNLGIYSLMAYLAKIPEDEYTIHHRIYIELSSNLSSRFAFAIPNTRVYGNHPLLLVQNEEFFWFNQINWREIILRKNDKKIYFISEKTFLKDKHYPIIPKFCIVLNLNNYSYIEHLSKCKKISIKNIWFDEVMNMHIPKGRINKEINIEFINQENYPIFSEDDIKCKDSQNNLLSSELEDFFQKIERKKIKYQGDRAKIDPDFIRSAKRDGNVDESFLKDVCKVAGVNLKDI